MLVKTITGYKPIANIHVGEQVLSRNEHTGQLSFQQVLNQYNNPYKQTVYIDIKDATGNTQTIVSNKIHPFFTKINHDYPLPPSSEGHDYQGDIDNAQWVDASNLKAGYQLLSENGEWQVVQKVRQTNEPLSAYNLTVNNDHTYFVTGSDSTYGVWVHNACFDKWGINEHVVTVDHHNWSKIFSDEDVTLDDVNPIIKEALRKGEWVDTGYIYHGAKGVKVGDKLILTQEVDGHTIWVEGIRFLDGTVSPKNAGVK
ncbi:polymorphic toxin-type HINT domain-containing protein [Psychrobacter sp. I-STPA6b]|uniref:polymorphic toxin-type HINT domain-containing protein n=1 Tax=Psychrobacter sp. I-STPA6b TaxID=2585718 RepID=UPI001D0BFC6A|nr:polymorphic toxin-type HINT domain-containing protein [Psychrobacter sp. I-STPA6b]